MSSIPSAEGFDSTLTLLRNPYGFISQTCRALDTDLFETRILLQKTICMTGSAAAEVFYSDDKLIRAGSMPGRIQKTLLGEGGIQGLDGAAHQHRKKMFMSLMGTEHIAALQGMSLHMLDNYAPDWEARNEVVFYDKVREMLTRAVCAWCGVPLPEAEVATRTAQLTALFEDAGAIGPKHWAARLARHRLEKWAAGMIQQVRDGELQPTQESALHVIATWRDLDGAILPPKVAARGVVERLASDRGGVCIHRADGARPVQVPRMAGETAERRRTARTLRSGGPPPLSILSCGRGTSQKYFRVARVSLSQRTPGSAGPLWYEHRSAFMGCAT